MNRRLEDKILPNMERIALFSGIDLVDTFNERSVAIIPRDTQLHLEIPQIVKTDLGPQLQISGNGANVWNDKTSVACESAGIDTGDLYVSSGLAKLEMTIAAKRALDGDWDFIPRITKTAQAIDKDREVSKVAYEISELSRVGVNKIVAGFKQSEIHELNLLRYGIGVALASMGLKSQEIDEFRSASSDFAISALDAFFNSGARFLAGHGFDVFDTRKTLGETINEAVGMEPPLIELASASAMNVTNLFNK